MNYSINKIDEFYIKKGSTLPELKYPLFQRVLEKFGITDDMLDNVAVTFSMIDADNGVFRIANVPAYLLINNNISENPSVEKYCLVYRFTQHQTSKTGRYLGEFVIDFLGSNCGKLKLPVNDFINITIIDSITNTTIV